MWKKNQCQISKNFLKIENFIKKIQNCRKKWLKNLKIPLKSTPKRQKSDTNLYKNLNQNLYTIIYKMTIKNQKQIKQQGN